MDTGQNDISKMSRVSLPLPRRAYGGEKEKEKKVAEKIETARYVTGPPAGKVNGRFVALAGYTIPTGWDFTEKKRREKRKRR